MSRPISQTLTINTVADWYRVDYQDILGSSRKPTIAKARHVAMYLLKVNGYSYNEVASMFCKNHTSVIYACNRVEKNRKNYIEFHNEVSDLNSQLSNKQC